MFLINCYNILITTSPTILQPARARSDLLVNDDNKRLDNVVAGQVSEIQAVAIFNSKAMNREYNVAVVIVAFLCYLRRPRGFLEPLENPSLYP